MLPSYDIAIVLGAALRDDGSPRPALRRRVGHGVALLRDGLVPRLLMSGGRVKGPWPEAWVMRDLALADGVAPEALLIEDASRDTVDNARLSLRLLAGTGWSRLLLVSDRPHLPRAQWIFRRYGATVDTSAPPLPPDVAEWPYRLREAGAMAVSAWKLWRRPA